MYDVSQATDIEGSVIKDVQCQSFLMLVFYLHIDDPHLIEHL